MIEKLQSSGIRVEADLRNEKLGYKIREAQLEKVPYMFIVGENEKNSSSVSVRKRGEGDIGAKTIDETVALLQEEIRNHVI
ncbi:Threonine--tRNA ligase [compost metagenome]